MTAISVSAVSYKIKVLRTDLRYSIVDKYDNWMRMLHMNLHLALVVQMKLVSEVL